MVEFMAKLRERITVGVVGGSDLPKQKEQLGETGAPLGPSPACIFDSIVCCSASGPFRGCVGKNL